MRALEWTPLPLYKVYDIYIGMIQIAEDAATAALFPQRELRTISTANEVSLFASVVVFIAEGERWTRWTSWWVSRDTRLHVQRGWYTAEV